MGRVELERQADAYAHRLHNFINYNNLPREWFAEPDHVAFKAYDRKGFEDYLTQIQDSVVSLSFIIMDGRRLAGAKLKKPLEMFGIDVAINWVEIMEPKLQKVGSDVIGFDHMEFWHPNFSVIRRGLSIAGIDSTIRENPHHRWVNVVIDQQTGQDVKFNNGYFEEMVEAGLESGEATIIV